MDELAQAREALYRLMHVYLVERDLEKTAACLTDDLYSVGTGNHEVARDAAAFRSLLEQELADSPEPYTLEWNMLKGKCSGGCAEFLGLLRVSGISQGQTLTIETRFTAVMRCVDGVYKASSLHLSTAEATQDDEEFFPVHFGEKTICQMRDELERKAMDVLSNSLPGGMMGGYLKPGWPLYFINAKMLEALDYTYEEFVRDIDGLVINCMHPDDQAMVERVVAQSLAGDNEQYEVRYRMRKRDGSYLWIFDRGRKVLTPEGHEAILSVCIDITESVRLQDELKEKTARLQEHNRELQRQQYYMSLMLSGNTVGMMIVKTDPCGTFVYVGENLMRFLGYEKEEFDRRFTDVRQLILDEDWERQRRQAQEQLEHGNLYQVEYRMTKKDGSRLWVQEQGRLSVEADGDAVYICTVLDISQHKRKQAQLERQSEQDSLTRLFNRGAGVRRIREYLSSMHERECCALCLLDLDNFKRINDTFGHMAGDQVLIQLGAILTSIFRKSDIAMRLGGDEFVVLMRDVRRRQDLVRKAELVRERVRRSMDSRIRLLGLSVSVGIAVTEGKNDFESLYQLADMALYRAKCAGKDQYVILPDGVMESDACHDAIERQP